MSEVFLEPSRRARRTTPGQLRVLSSPVKAKREFPVSTLSPDTALSSLPIGSRVSALSSL